MQVVLKYTPTLAANKSRYEGQLHYDNEAYPAFMFGEKEWKELALEFHAHIARAVEVIGELAHPQTAKAYVIVGNDKPFLMALYAYGLNGKVVIGDRTSYVMGREGIPCDTGETVFTTEEVPGP